MSNEILKLKALLAAIVKELRLNVVETPCHRCNNGKWQDGDDCGHCDGAAVVFKVTCRPPDFPYHAGKAGQP